MDTEVIVQEGMYWLYG